MAKILDDIEKMKGFLPGPAVQYIELLEARLVNTERLLSGTALMLREIMPEETKLHMEVQLNNYMEAQELLGSSLTHSVNFEKLADPK